MARSRWFPCVRRSAGARLMVTDRAGLSKPQFLMAAGTRSRLSRTAASGNPTI